MKPVFADSVYFFGLPNERDRIRHNAVQYAARAENPIVTTAWVLTELADGMASRTARQACGCLRY